MYQIHSMSWFISRINVWCPALKTLLMLLLYFIIIKSRVKCGRQMSIRYYFYRNSPWHVSCIASPCLFVLGFFITSQQGVGSFGFTQKPCCQGPLSCSSRRDDSECKRWTTSFLLKRPNMVPTWADCQIWFANEQEIGNSCDNWSLNFLVVIRIYKSALIFWRKIQYLKCYLLSLKCEIFSFFLCDSKLNLFWFWTIHWTKQDALRYQLGLKKLVTDIFAISSHSTHIIFDLDSNQNINIIKITVVIYI